MKAKLLLFSIPLLIASVACGATATTSVGAPSQPASTRSGFPPKVSTTSGASSAGGALTSSGAVGSTAAGSTAATVPLPAPVQDQNQLAVPPLPSSQHLELAATIGIQMPHDKFDDGLNAVLAIISMEHGYLSASNTEASPGGAPRSGSFSFQVPVDNYQDTLSQLRSVGKFTGQQSTSKPHDAEYVDLQSRLKSAQLQLDAFNALLARATSIGDIISIEQQVGQVQQQIEEDQGQLRYLDSLTQYSTVTVNLTEKGAVPAPRPVGDQWGFAASLQQALHNLAAVANGLILVLGTLLPFLVLGALAFATRRRWLPVFART